MCACTCVVVVVVVVVGKVRRNPGGAAILTCKSFDILGEGGERQTEPSHGWFSSNVSPGELELNSFVR